MNCAFAQRPPNEAIDEPATAATARARAPRRRAGDDAAAARAERRAHRDLPLARGRAREHQRRDVRAADAEQPEEQHVGGIEHEHAACRRLRARTTSTSTYGLITGRSRGSSAGASAATRSAIAVSSACARVEADAGRQPAEDRDARGPLRAGNPARRHHERDPEAVVRPGNPNASRHDADDRVGARPRRTVRPRIAGIAVEARLPQVLADHATGGAPGARRRRSAGGRGAAASASTRNADGADLARR